MLNIITRTTKQATWEEIKAAIKAGTINELMNSGDTIPVMLKNGECVALDLACDEKGKYFFVLYNCLHDAHAMNTEAVNTGAWAESDMRRYLNEEILPLIPDDLQAVIEPCVISQVVNGEETETLDKLFCLSATQVFGAGEWSETEPEDAQLDIFNTERSRVKEFEGHGTTWWWLRSAGDNNDFRNTGNSGNANTNLADATAGVVFAFTV